MQRRRLLRLPEFRPGHVFWFPRGSTWLNRDKPRPFTLATSCSAGQLGTLIYGTTRRTEAEFGATCFEIDPSREGVNRNGLDEKTAFYPGILVRDRYERLPPHAGSVGKSLGELRAALRTALGIGRGSCLSAGAAAGSRRGRIVRLEERLAHTMRTPFAVLLTETGYSRARRYHLILPLVQDDGSTPVADVLRLVSREWMSVFPGSTASALLPIPVVHSVWYGYDIVEETEYVVDEESLREIDARLCEFFSLPPAVLGI
jgi:hypothetical protein